MSATCPAVVEFIRVKYPSLIENLAPLLPPAESPSGGPGRPFQQPESARNLCQPVPGSCRDPSVFPKNTGGGALILPIERIFNRVKAALRSPQEPAPESQVSEAFRREMGWAVPGGESRALGIAPPFMASGLERVGRVLDRVEAGLLGGGSLYRGLGLPRRVPERAFHRSGFFCSRLPPDFLDAGA